MSKRRHQTQTEAPTAIKSKKIRKKLNNNEHEDAEVSRKKMLS